jgi:hypothetical protein
MGFCPETRGITSRTQLNWRTSTKPALKACERDCFLCLLGTQPGDFRKDSRRGIRDTSRARLDQATEMGPLVSKE